MDLYIYLFSYGVKTTTDEQFGLFKFLYLIMNQIKKFRF